MRASISHCECFALTADPRQWLMIGEAQRREEGMDRTRKNDELTDRRTS